MPTDPTSVLDRVARDLSRTYLHGSRTSGSALMVATGQQIEVAVPANGDDMPFQFVVGDPTHPFTVTVGNVDAVQADLYMAQALDLHAPYLQLQVDDTLPIWICNGCPYSSARPPATQDELPVTLSGNPFTAVALPAAVIEEVEETSGSYISLWQKNAATPIPAATWQPAVVVRFPLKYSVTIPATETVQTAQVFELSGTPQGDRYFLDQLGLLGNITNPPTIAAFVLTLESFDTNGNAVRQAVDTWTIARTNLTTQARPNIIEALVRSEPTLDATHPYIALSIDAGYDAIRLLQMASITNSGGYFLRATANSHDAVNLILTVVLQSSLDPTPPNDPLYDPEGALLPVAANAIVFQNWAAPAAPAAAFPDIIRFNGPTHVQVAPAAKPGYILSGWTREEPLPENITLDIDHFGYGVLSLIEYSASDATGNTFCTFEQCVAISPGDPPTGDSLPRSAEAVLAAAHAHHTGDTSVLRLRSRKAPATVGTLAAKLDSPNTTVVRNFRTSIKCFSDASKPWARLASADQSSITFKPGIRSLYGNRVPLPQAPLFKRRLFYTDALIGPAEWPGVSFALYPSSSAGSPTLTLEMSYHVLLPNPDNQDSTLPDSTGRLKQLEAILAQLNGAGDNDISITLSAVPLVDASASIAVSDVISNLQLWHDLEQANASSVAPRVDPPVVTYSFPMVDTTTSVTDCTHFDPQIVITRTNKDYCPQPTDLPSGALGGSINKQIKSVSSSVPLHPGATPSATTVPPVQPPNFLDVAKAFQAVIVDVRVAFLRDQVNIHELWFIPNNFFPVADAGGEWNYATPRPLHNQLGSETFQAPDFAMTCANLGTNCWSNAAGTINYPLVTSAVIEQDYDELGRTAFRFLEKQTSDLSLLTDPTNAPTMRSLLATREAIANTLAQFDAPSARGWLVPLFAPTTPPAPPLDTAAITRVATDAFRRDLSSFYAVSTIVQLPLLRLGNQGIQLFEGTVTAKFADTENPLPHPSFSDVLLGQSSSGVPESKITILYDLPGSAKQDEVPALSSLQISFTHVQLPLDGDWTGANGFNQGRWLQLASPWDVGTWTNVPSTSYVPVADRTMPSKPILQSTGSLLAAAPDFINKSNASLLAAWGWRFTLGLVNADQNDQVQIEVRYSTAATTPPSPLRTLLASTWSPDDLLASLYIIKLLQDNWAAIQQVSPAPPTPRDPLAALDALASSLLGFLVDAPSSAIPLPSTGPNVYILGIGAGTVKSNNASSVMQSALTVAPQLAAHLPLSLATVTALADAAGNHASLVGQSPLHSFKVSLTLVRNAEFNPALVYQRAPVESPRDVFPFEQLAPHHWSLSSTI